jgi:hypothetical protein
MRRLFIFFMLSILSLPVGMSVVGCKNNPITFCNGGDSGLEVGQVNDVVLQPRLTGISLNYGEAGQLNTPTALDCRGNPVTVTSFSYGTTNMNIIDVSPLGALCAGSWNRNSPAGIADFTTCTATNQSGVAYLTASSEGATSNTVAVYAHAPITSIVLNPPETTSGTTVNGCVSQGNSVQLTSTTYSGSNVIAGTVIPITAWSISSGVATFQTAHNSLTAGQLVSLSSFATAAPALALTSAGNTSGGTTVYSGTITGGAGNALAGQQFVVVGFDNGANNGTFTATASSANSLTLSNSSGVSDTHTASATAVTSGAIFNGLIVPVLSTGLGIGQFEVDVSAPNGYATQSGIATTTIGNIIYTAQNNAIVSIVNSNLVMATAEQPGATLVSAALSDATSTAGYFYTCPPAKITLTPGNLSSLPIVIDPNYTSSLLATVTDTAGNPITGLSLTFNSTTPATTVVSNAGLITANWSGAANISAVCLPSDCNPAPLNVTGINGAGEPITSNTVPITTPGTNSTVLYIASTQSQYYTSMDFTRPTVGTPVRLPYVPNSMVTDPGGDVLYFGSSTELMTVSPSSNTILKQDVTAPGMVLGLSPSGTLLVISDPVHSLIYLYNTSTDTFESFGGTGTKAVFSPDSTTVYISGGSEEYVYSQNSGWNAYPATTTNVNDVTIASPAVGAFFAGSNTSARSYCPNNQIVPTVFYPATTDLQPATQKVSATNDGNHVLGGNLSGSALTLYDFGIVTPVQECPQAPYGTAGPVPNFSSTVRDTVPILGTSATAVTGVPVASNSALAFLTYTSSSSASGATLPGYAPVLTGAGTAQNVTLSGSATAPLAGVFSSDNLTFYAGTSGDNQVHVISTGGVTAATIAFPGNNYTVGDVINIVQGGVSTAQVQVTSTSGGSSTGSKGSITGITLISSGAAYTSAPGLSGTGGTGNLATFNITATAMADMSQITPLLPLNTGVNGAYAPPNLLAQKPRSVN